MTTTATRQVPFCCFAGDISLTPHCEVALILPRCPDEEAEAREVKSLAQVHTAGKQQSWG